MFLRQFYRESLGTNWPQRRLPAPALTTRRNGWRGAQIACPRPLRNRSPRSAPRRSTVPPSWGVGCLSQISRFTQSNHHACVAYQARGIICHLQPTPGRAPRVRHENHTSRAPLPPAESRMNTCRVPFAGYGTARNLRSDVQSGAKGRLRRR